MEAVRIARATVEEVARFRRIPFVRQGLIICDEEHFEGWRLEDFFSDEGKNTKAVYVSIYSNGVLRGRSGAVFPRYENLATHIIKAAYGAANQDPEFEPVTEDELENLTYCVDLISARDEWILMEQEALSAGTGLSDNGDSPTCQQGQPYLSTGTALPVSGDSPTCQRGQPSLSAGTALPVNGDSPHCQRGQPYLSAGTALPVNGDSPLRQRGQPSPTTGTALTVSGDSPTCQQGQPSPTTTAPQHKYALHIEKGFRSAIALPEGTECDIPTMFKKAMARACIHEEEAPAIHLVPVERFM